MLADGSDMTESIFELLPITDNPIYEGFGTGDAPSLFGRGKIADDFYPTVRSDWNWTPKILTPLWKPIRVVGRVRPFNDFPCMAPTIPVFSKRAVDGLRDYLEPNGEILPLDSNVGEYFAFNCTTVVEILDQGKCVANWSGERRPATANWIKWFSVIPERAIGLTIFHLRELCNRVFVTDQFVQRVQLLRLNGFNFVKVWPFPEGVDYGLKNSERRRQRGNRVRSVSGIKEVKSESMTIDFPLMSSKISLEEKKTIARFQDELDALLVTHSEDEVYFGNLEGRTTGKGKTRLVLSCPDCKALLEKLRPWLISLEWPAKPLVYLRHGSWDDTEVEEILASV